MTVKGKDISPVVQIIECENHVSVGRKNVRDMIPGSCAPLQRQKHADEGKV